MVLSIILYILHILYYIYYIYYIIYIIYYILCPILAYVFPASVLYTVQYYIITAPREFGVFWCGKLFPAKLGGGGEGTKHISCSTPRQPAQPFVTLLRRTSVLGSRKETCSICSVLQYYRQRQVEGNSKS